MKYLPEWFPGANFQREARLWRASVEKMLHVPFNVVKQRMVRSIGVFYIDTLL